MECSAGSLQGATLTIPLHPRLVVQGCLGLKSPFIEFSNELEVLANNSIPLNITKDEQALMHQEGLRKLGTFIKPVDLRDSETGYVKADLTKKVYSPGSYGPQTQRRLHPIQEEMDQKQIILLDEDTDENGLPASLTDEDRKFIVPMALKNASPDPRWAQATFRGTTTTTSTTTRAPITTTNKQQQQQQQQQQQRSTTPATPEFASNIEDLKKHILFLQNLTKHDSTFQSKFVVFPSLQKDKQRNSSSATTTTTTTRTPFRPIFQYSAPIIPPTRKSTLNINSKIPQVPPFGGYYHNQNEDDEDSLSQFFAPVNPRDKIAIVPQVLLLNDQNKDRNDKRKSFSILPLPTTTTTTTSTTATTTTTTTTTTTRRPTKPTKLPPCVRNPDSPKCVRQRKREELQRQRDREQLLREQEKYMPRYEPYLQTLNNTKRFAVSIEIPDSFKIPYNESESSKQRAVEENLQILSRFVRSTHKRRNIGGGLTGRSNEKFASKYGSSGAFLDRDAALSAANGRDFVLSNAEQFGMLPVNSSTPTTTVEPYSEPIDLNPDNCYQVEGMTYGQKKQCVLHTSVMPAISRGARAAIQECQFQFKNRRWNCTTIEDNTVFGPMTGLGSPEMAFIHALAAATVTSFIARACRDGQLASCGCSSGSRPKQLNDDWTWGGCGDNLEYAYKFATDFIDVREKETRRGTRGVGNPEKRKNLRLYQTRRQRHHQQQQPQQMLADDASDFAALPRTVSTVNTNLNGSTTVTKSQQRLSANNGKGKSKSDSNNNNNNNYDNSNTATLVSAVAVSIGSINDDIALTRHDIKSLENSNKTVNTEAINLRNTYTDSSSNVNRTTSSVSSYSIQPSSSTTSSSSSLASLASSSSSSSFRGSSSPSTISSNLTLTVDAQPLPPLPLMPQQSASRSSFVAVPRQEKDSSEEYNTGRIKPEDLLELQERITKEILNSKLQEKEMLELQEKINREILNSKVFNMDAVAAGATSTSNRRKRKRKNQRAVNGMVADVGGYNSGGSNLGYAVGPSLPVGSSSKWKNSISLKARSLMNLHNNEAGRRAVIKKTRITCKCHGVSGSCSLITCWQQLSSIREIGDYLREKYEESTEVKLNKRGRLQVKDAQFKVPTAHDLIYFDESPDWCRSSRQLQWPGTHGRICNKTSNGLDGCGILCCGRGYNTKSIVVRERCNCKFHWCCQVKCELCVRTIEEHTCK